MARKAKFDAYEVIADAIFYSKYTKPYDKALEVVGALDRAGLKIIRKPKTPPTPDTEQNSPLNPNIDHTVPDLGGA